MRAHLKVCQLVRQTRYHIFGQTQGGQVDQGSHLRGQVGQSVAIQVELGQVGQLPQAGRQRGNVGLAEVQPLPSLLLACQERSARQKLTMKS